MSQNPAKCCPRPKSSGIAGGGGGGDGVGNEAVDVDVGEELWEQAGGYQAFDSRGSWGNLFHTGGKRALSVFGERLSCSHSNGQWPSPGTEEPRGLPLENEIKIPFYASFL